MAEFRIDPAQLDASAKRAAEQSTDIMARIQDAARDYGAAEQASTHRFG